MLLDVKNCVLADVINQVLYVMLQVLEVTLEILVHRARLDDPVL